MISLRGRLALAGVGGVLAIVIVGLIAVRWILFDETYPWKAAGIFGAMVAVAAGAMGTHHPFARLGPANRVTLVRVGLLALVASLIGEPSSPRVAWAGVAGGALFTVLDGVDGWLARRSRMTSDFGARFDTETDALLILVLSMLLWQHEKAGAWVLSGGLLRYGFIAAGWWLPWLAAPLRPTFRGKAVAVTHMAGLIVALVPVVPRPASTIVAAATLALLFWSFAVDVRRLSRNRKE